MRGWRLQDGERAFELLIFTQSRKQNFERKNSETIRLLLTGTFFSPSQERRLCNTTSGVELRYFRFRATSVPFNPEKRQSQDEVSDSTCKHEKVKCISCPKLKTCQTFISTRAPVVTLWSHEHLLTEKLVNHSFSNNYLNEVSWPVSWVRLNIFLPKETRKPICECPLTSSSVVGVTIFRSVVSKFQAVQTDLLDVTDS